MATYTFKGTGISGTSTAAKAFPGSKLGWASAGNTYLNKETGHVYKCTAEGWPNDAKWKYVRTDVIKKPTVAVSGLTLIRDGKGSRTMTGKWTVPKAAVDAKRCDRATGLKFTWTLDTSGKDVIDKETTGNEKKTSDTENLSNLYVGNGTSGRHYTRASFYPYAGKPRLRSVTLKVTPTNAKGDGLKSVKNAKGKVVGSAIASKTYTFEAPKKPTVSVVGFDDSNGEVTFKVDTDPGEGKAERLWTEYKMTVTDKTLSSGQTYVAQQKENETATSKTLVFDATRWQQLVGDQYISVKVDARARGYAGDSDWVSRTYYLGFPRPVTLKGEDITVTSGQVIVPITVNNPKVDGVYPFPVDYVRLEALADVSYASAADIPGSASWTPIEPGDDGQTTALVANRSDLVPAVGNHTWVRVKAWHGSESLCSYSNVAEVPLFVAAPTATDNECTIASASAGDEAGSVDVCVCWDSKSTDTDQDTTGIELSWSDDVTAWKSTKVPSTFEFSWEDTVPSSHSSSWNKAGEISVRGLEEGGAYYFRARCLTDDSEGRRTYGSYCNAVKATAQAVSIEPSAVLVASRSVPQGADLAVSWVLSADSPQEAWYVMCGDAGDISTASTTTTTTTTTTEPEYYDVPSNALASGTGLATSAVVPASKLARFADDGEVEIFVRCIAGGREIDSEPTVVSIAEPPSLVVGVDTLTHQPMEIDVESTHPDVSVALTVTSDGTDGSDASGFIDQMEGETIATGVFAPPLTATSWASTVEYAELTARATVAQDAKDAAEDELEDLQEGDDGYDEAMARLAAAAEELAIVTAALAAGGTRYKGTVTLPEKLPFVGGTSYTVTAVATDRSTGLKSDTVTVSFGVNWTHKAPEPPQDGYEPTSDTTPQTGKTYYEEAQDGSYVEVETPVAADMEDYYEAVTGITVEPFTTTVDGEASRGCILHLVAPSGAASTDVYDIYRVTHDGPMLVGSNVAMNRTITDDYATFGDAMDYRYRIACRTADGDVSWADYDYSLEADVLRFDYGPVGIELPYDIKISDAYEKDAIYRAHDDGSTAVFENPAVTRKASLSTRIVRIEDAETARRVREMAQRTGTVYVRTPDGSAYEAGIKVKTMDVGHGVIDASFEATKVTETGAYSLPLEVTT